MADSPLMRGSHSHRLARRVFVGSLVSPQTLLSINIINTAVIGVGTSGVIRFVEDLDEYKKEQSESARVSTHKQHNATRKRDISQEDDRSSTPVPIPSSQDVGTGPEIAASSSSSSFLSEQFDAEQMVLHNVVAKHGWNLQECELVQLSKDSFLCPGFIDTHTHAPQVPNLGLGQQYELLDWLQYVTFPRERKFEDPIYARKTYESVVERMINSGTTCAAIYATLHEEATMILADICNQRGLRALVGKCQMDRNSPVDYVEKNPSASMEATRNFINYCRALKPYGSPQSVGEDVASPQQSTPSESPEMNSSIARLKVTMNEMIDGKEDKDTSESSDPSSGSNFDTTSSSSQTTPTTASSNAAVKPLPSRSNSSQQPKAHSLHRHSSLSSSTSSLGANGNGRAKSSSQSTSTSTSSSSGYDSPRRQKEREYANALVQPILTPRFAISCSDALLTSISAMMSRDPNLRIQTHLSENEGEIEFTKKLFPFTSCYTEVYDHFSLLTPRTILAHAIHLDEEEMKLIGKRKCGISHCPTSNNNLRSGVSRVGEMLNRGIKVGLGTDMSGGFGLSILSAIREASVVAKVLKFKPVNSRGEGEEKVKDDDGPPPAAASSATKEFIAEKNQSPAVGNHQHHTRQVEKSGSELNRKRAQVENYDFCNGPLSVATLFYLATLGGAEVCNLAHRVGSLDVGKEFDALLINTANGCPNLYIEDEDEVEERLEKFLFCGDDRNIASVFVRGRVVGGSSPI